MMQGYGPGYNSTSHPNNLNGTGTFGSTATGWSNGWTGNSGYPQAPNNTPNGGRVYVNGRAEADNYPMPPGVNEITLWDKSGDRLYIKAYDNNGYPRVLEDYDVATHVEPEPPEYVTKDDIRAIIQEMLGERSQTVNTKNYAQRNDKNGRGSRNDESNG